MNTSADLFLNECGSRAQSTVLRSFSKCAESGSAIKSVFSGNMSSIKNLKKGIDNRKSS